MMGEVAQLGMKTGRENVKQNSKCRSFSGLFESASPDLAVTMSTLNRNVSLHAMCHQAFQDPAQSTCDYPWNTSPCAPKIYKPDALCDWI